MNDSRLVVPPLGAGEALFPTLGPEVADFIEDQLVHGPGDLLGQPARIIDEIRGFIYRAYEVYPRGHEQAGRRRFKRAVLSRRKGVGKTEIAAWLAVVEMDPEAPVRCDGWRKVGGEWVPVGRPVRDPYIPMVATTEEQTEDLAYGAVRAILEHCDLGEDYDIGLDRILHRHAPGEIKPLASAPRARDGARTTFQHFDETHLFTELRLKNSHSTMLRNVPKRRLADAWSLETSTMYAPGEASVAEASHRYALEVLRGKAADPRLLFDHRQAGERWDISKRDQLIEAIKEASGDAWAFTDLQAILALFDDPTNDENELQRFWLNRKRKRAQTWSMITVWDSLAKRRRPVPDGAHVVLGFDGSYDRDSTALVGATVERVPHVFVVKAWERPLRKATWRVSRSEVEDELEKAMERWRVVELAPDPPGWHREIEDWEDTYGEVVVRFETNQPRRMGPAIDDFEQAVRDAELTHDGSEVLHRHIGNAVRTESRGQPVIRKSEPDSPDKIDAAVAAVIAHHRARWHLANDREVEPFIL